MGVTVTAASFFRQITECMRSGHFLQKLLFFRQITECMRSGHFLQKLLNYWTGQRKRIQVSAKSPLFIYSVFDVTYKTEPTKKLKTLDLATTVFFVLKSNRNSKRYTTLYFDKTSVFFILKQKNYPCNTLIMRKFWFCDFYVT